LIDLYKVYVFHLKVVVSVNDIVSACNENNCEYQYSDAQTPIIHSITPNKGAGIVLKFLKTLFLILLDHEQLIEYS